MKKFYITIIMALLPILMFSQGENDNWYFGQNAGVNFTGTVPLALTDSQMNTEEATGIVSDKNGKLLFYTDGSTVWDRQHQIMTNGTGLLGSYSSQQLAIARNPANPMQYYIFTGATIGFPNTYIAYTIVDMSQGNIGTNGLPLGKVISNLTNVPIKDNNGNLITSEALTLVMHEDNHSLWLLIPNGNSLFSYRITDLGFNPIPVVSSLNLSTTLGSNDYFGIKASPRIEAGSGFTNYLSINLWLPTANYQNKILSFDDSSGVVTPHYSVDIYSSVSYSSEFNSDGKILYLGRFGVFAINLLFTTSSTNVVYNQIFSGNSQSPFYGMQRNKYGDIYLSNVNYEYLSKINNPDTYGGSSVTLNDIYLNGKKTYLGLPQPVSIVDTGVAQCVPNYVLQNQETNTGYTYSAADYIITKDNYSMNNTNQHIEMKAENYISFLPNTFIKGGSDLLAKIEVCNLGSKKAKTNNTSFKRTSLTLDLDKAIQNDNITIYPNPASDFLMIESTLKVENVSVYDISGKKINVAFTNNKVDVKNLLQGSYLLIIETKEGKTTKKFIKK